MIKRIFTLLLTALLVFTLVGCGNTGLSWARSIPWASWPRVIPLSTRMCPPLPTSPLHLCVEPRHRSTYLRRSCAQHGQQHRYHCGHRRRGHGHHLRRGQQDFRPRVWGEISGSAAQGPRPGLLHPYFLSLHIKDILDSGLPFRYDNYIKKRDDPQITGGIGYEQLTSCHYPV